MQTEGHLLWAAAGMAAWGGRRWWLWRGQGQTSKFKGTQLLLAGDMC